MAVISMVVVSMVVVSMAVVGAAVISATSSLHPSGRLSALRRISPLLRTGGRTRIDAWLGYGGLT